MRQASVWKKPPHQGEGPGPAPDSRAGVRCGPLPPSPTLGAPSTPARRPRRRPAPRPPDHRGPGIRAGARAAACPPPPYLRGPGRGRYGPLPGAPRRRGSATEAPRLAGAELGGGFATSNSIGSYRDSPVGGGGGRGGASSSSLRLLLHLLLTTEADLEGA